MPRMQSSVMTNVDYDEDAAELDVTFVSGKIYRYFGVPLATYVDLLDAESHGAFFNESIKDVFPFVEVKPRRR
jgi:KTSC domain